MNESGCKKLDLAVENIRGTQRELDRIPCGPALGLKLNDICRHLDDAVTGINCIINTETIS